MGGYLIERLDSSKEDIRGLHTRLKNFLERIRTIDEEEDSGEYDKIADKGFPWRSDGDNDFVQRTQTEINEIQDNVEQMAVIVTELEKLF